MKFAIMGSGGVGGYFGGRLAQAGNKVTFIARGAHLAALQSEGLRVSSISGDFHLASVDATDNPVDVGEVDCVLVSVKGWQLAEAAEQIRPMVGPDTLVVPLLNGVESRDVLSAVLGEEVVLEGLCAILAWREGPGHIHHAGGAASLTVGEHDNRPSERVERLRQVLASCDGFKVLVPDDIRVAVWSKFTLICAMSGIGSLCRAPMGVTRSLPESRELIEALLRETVRVGVAAGVALPEDLVARTLANFDRMPADATASMQRDIMAGLPSELESQNGAVVRLGRRYGVDTPVNRVVYGALLPQELKARRS